MLNLKPLFFALFLITVWAVSGACQTEDKCTVTLFEDAALKKMMRKFDDDPSLVNSEQAWRDIKTLGEFDTVIDEERLTSKAFRIPRSKKYVIASVFYTDESMSVSAGKEISSNDSVLLGIAVSPRKAASATAISNRSLAEANLSKYLKAMRVSTVTQIRGRRTTIVLECRWNSSVEMK